MKFIIHQIYHASNAVVDKFNLKISVWFIIDIIVGVFLTIDDFIKKCRSQFMI